MYNRYIPDGNTHKRIPVDEDAAPPHSGQRRQSKPPGAPTGQGSHNGHGVGRELFRNLAGPLRFLYGEEKNAGIAGILKGFDLEDIDSGDILLLLIILLLFLDGDNTELVITLGLMLLLGLGEKKKEDQTE